MTKVQTTFNPFLESTVEGVVAAELKVHVLSGKRHLHATTQILTMLYSNNVINNNTSYYDLHAFSASFDNKLNY